jgi:hypothetical protein
MTKKHAPQYFICSLNFKSHNFQTEIHLKHVAPTYRGSTTLSFLVLQLCLMLRTVTGGGDNKGHLGSRPGSNAGGDGKRRVKGKGSYKMKQLTEMKTFKKPSVKNAAAKNAAAKK